MSERIWRWPDFCLGACLLAGLLIGLGMVARPDRAHPDTGPPAGPAGKEAELRMLRESPPAVGWVFGRVVGFEGADKPLLPRPVPPMLPPVSPSPGISR